MNPPHTLQNLTPREAIADSLYRLVLGLDLNDRALFHSAWKQDSNASFKVGKLLHVQGWETVNEYFERAFNVTTHHSISAVRVDVKDGANSASLSASMLSYHMRPDEALKPEDTSYTAGTLVFLDVVRDEQDGVWKITSMSAQVQWLTGDVGIVHPGGKM